MNLVDRPEGHLVDILVDGRSVILAERQTYSEDGVRFTDGGIVLPGNFRARAQRGGHLTIFLSIFGVGYPVGNAAQIEQTFPSALRQRLFGHRDIPLYRVTIPENPH